MAICKNIATALGGRYGIRSALRKGRTFWFVLMTGLSLEGSDRLTMGSALRVLSPDDNTSTATVMKKLFGRLGYEVDVAVNGADCLDKLASAQYDVLFIDKIMPVMTGYDALMRLRSRKNDIPIISLSDRTDKDMKERLKKLGVHKILLKPFNMHTVYGAVKRAMANA